MLRILDVTHNYNSVSAQVPPLGVYLINESPHITNDSVRAEFQITRAVLGVRCFLRSQYDRVWQDCKLYLNNDFLFWHCVLFVLVNITLPSDNITF